MPRHAPELECSTEDKASLVALTKSHTAEARAVQRARIILACLEGKEIQQVARELRVSVPSVSKWRRRFSLWGLRGLRDQSRPGKPVKYDTVFRNRVLALLEETPPPGMSHWDGPTVAEKLDASVHAVWRVLRREGIFLQRRRSWCVSKQVRYRRSQTGVWFYPSFVELNAKPEMQPFHHWPAVFLVEVEALFGRHALRSRRFVVPVDLAQTFQYKPALLRKVWHHLHKVAASMCETMPYDDFQFLG